MSNEQIRELEFTNSDATPKVVTIKCDTASIPLIMAWYGAYFDRDRYFVTVDGVKVDKDINGEPVNEVA